MAETETAGLNEARLAAIEAHVARRHAAGAFHGHTADGEWWSVLEEYQRDTTALVAEVRRLRAALEEYGRHNEGCSATFGPEYDCRCGWREEAQALGITEGWPPEAPRK